MRSSKNSSLALTTLLLAGLLLSWSSADGQIMYGRPASGDLRVVYSHWSLKSGAGTTEINQLTIPISGFVPIRDNLEALFFIANSSNSLKQSDRDYNLSGLGDVRLQLNRSFKDDQFLLSVGMNLPTGKKKLSRDEELRVVQALSQNHLSFPMRLFGEGFGFNVLLGTAQMLGELRCGAGVMYQYTGNYQPFDDTGTYNPADFVSINAGADWQNDRTALSGDIVFTAYNDDKFRGVKEFKRTSEVYMRLRAAFDDGHDYGLSTGISYLLRGRNTLHTAATKQKIFGDEFRIDGRLTRRFQRGWRVTPMLDFKLIGANDQSFGSSTIFGFGAEVRRRFSEQVSASIGGNYYTGSADDGAIDLSGYQLSAGLVANL